MDVFAAPQNTVSQKVSYVRNERMAGFVPVYNTPKITENQGVNAIASTFQPQNDTPVIMHESKAEDKFGFFDLLDMINPFQHIPLVNIAYRAITGDEIKPISRIIGGAIFGGPLGMAGGIVNTVIEEETGEDAIGNAIAFVKPQHSGDNKVKDFQIEKMAYNDLPVTLLEFAEIPLPKRDTYQS